MNRRALLVFMVALLGCSPNADSSGGSDATPADFCSGLVRSWLSRYAGCAQMTLSDDVLAAAATPSALPVCAAAQQAVRNGRSSFDADRASQCLARFPEGDCQRLREDDPLRAFDECATVFQGIVQQSGACAYDFDCAAGYCDSSDGVCPGTCRAWLREGDDCMLGRCAPHLACADAGDGSRRCVAVPSPSGEGGACGDVQKCQAGLYCAGGVCAPLKSSGACTDTRECATDRTCASSSLSGAGSCVPFLPLGAPCETYPESCFLSNCSAAATCVPRPQIGEACVDGDVTLACGEGWCSGAVCSAFTPVGQACTSDPECGMTALCSASAGSSARLCQAIGCSEP
jgi:hypothetical protein